MRSFCSRDTARRVPTTLFAFILISAVALAGEEGSFPATTPKPPAQETKKETKEDLSKPVAAVNGVSIRLLDLKKAMQERLPETGHSSLSQKRLVEIRREVLDTLIVQEVLFQEAKRLGIKAPPDSVEAELQKIEARFPSEGKYREALKQQSLTLDEIRTGIERYLAVKNLTDEEVRSKIKISDDQMKSYYEGHPEQFKLPEQIRLRILLVRVDPSSLSEDWEKARVKAMGYVERAKKGEDFAALVRQFSDDQNTKDQGGDMGLLHQGRLPFSELDAVAYSYSVGQISEPVQTLYGYVVFKVEEKRPAVEQAFKDLNKDLLRKEMQESATEAKLKEWIDGLRSKAEIKIY